MYYRNKPRKTERGWMTFGLLVFFIVLILLLVALSVDGKDLMITEIMASNRVVLQDEDGDYPDWIEIHNPKSRAINLEGYWLSNDPDEPMQWMFPGIVIEPGEHLVVFASGKNRSSPDRENLHTDFRINRSGDAVVFGHIDGRILDEIVFEEKIPSNISFGRPQPYGDEWAYFLDATPGEPNEKEPYEDVFNLPGAQDHPVYINEFLVRNYTSIMDEDSELHEWIELYNSGDANINLEGYWLSDKESNPFKWRFPGVTIGPGEYLIIFASGKNIDDPDNPFLHVNFGLNDRDDELVFKTPDGKTIDLIPIRAQHDDISYGRDPGDPDSWLFFPRPTPGEVNKTMGYEELAAYPAVEEGTLIISEVMAENLTTIADEDGDYPDWIELHNQGTEPVNLEGFGLSDDEDDLFRWVLPSVEINPGDYLLVFASRKDRRDPENDYLHTNYQIQATGETISLTHPTGLVLDSLHSGKLLPDLSVGHCPGGSGNRTFFKKASPGAPNEGEVFSGFGAITRVSSQGGFFDNPVTVELFTDSPDAEIRYTLNGREPAAHLSRYNGQIFITEDTRLQTPSYEEGKLYSGPIEITETTVLRARVFEEGKLPGPTVNRTFFIGDDHHLPVISIMGDPDDFFDPVRGIYMKGRGGASYFPYRGANFWQNIEIPVHMEFFEPGGEAGFSFDLGLRIAGQYSRAEPQKSFNLFARNIYGYNEFTYPFFPDFYPEKPLSNKGLTLRTSGQDWQFSKIRDIFMTSLLDLEHYDYQAYRQTVLYINGQYWGIYNLRERINNHYLHYNHGVDPDRVDLLQGNGWVRTGSNDHYRDMLDFVRSNDLSNPDSYNHVAAMMDIDNYIDYWIAQIYFAQTDLANIRFWREQNEDGKWRWITFDLDWGFWEGNHANNTLAYATLPGGTGPWRNLNTDLINGLLRNSDFRERFIERSAFHLNNTFKTERVIEKIDELASNIEPEMPRHLDRWGGSMDRWHRQVEVLRNFAELRQEHVLNHLKSYFNLSEEEMFIFDEWN